MRIFFNIAILMIAGIFIAHKSRAQIVGSEAFMQGNFVQVGVSQCGVFGTVSPAPTGYNANAPGGVLGFIADGQKDGWTNGEPPFCGDYFVPGSPEEGFSIEIDGQNYGNFQNDCITNDISGSITNYSNTGGVVTVTWTGIVNGLSVVQTTRLNAADLYFTTTVTLTNTTTSQLNNVYYMRNVDPDNEQPITGNFDTQNSIEFQPGTTGCPRALVTAVGPSTGCFLGLGTIDQRARVSFGGFINRSASEIWNGTYVSHTGTKLADEAISLAFNLGNIAPGASQVISYAYILSAEDLINVLPTPPTPPVTANGTNITTTNLYQGCTNEPVNIAISDGGNYTWTWSPTTDIVTQSITGNAVTILPQANRTYTVTGVNECGQEIEKEIEVEVSTRPEADAGPDRIVCPGTSVNIGPSTYTYPHTYSWTSVPSGFTSSVFNPSVSPTQTTTYILTQTNNGCSSVDQVKVEVLDINLIDGPGTVCTGGSGYVYSIPSIPGATYNWWIEGSGNITSGQGTNSVTVSFPWFTGGSINVGINLTGSYCQLTLPITVAPPTITVTPSTASICEGYPVTLTASGATSYSWSPSTGLNTTTGPVVIANPTTTTTYTVTGTVDGCSSQGSATVTITIKPESECCYPGLITKCSGNTYTPNTSTDFNMQGYPQGIAIDNSGNFFIANSYYHRLDKFNSAGVYQTSFTASMLQPLGVANDPSGNIFVADHANRRIIKFSPAGTVLATFQMLNTIGEALYPVFVEADNCGFVYVTATHGDYISKFDNDGNFISNIVVSLPGETGTPHIRGVAVDNAGNIFVNDHVNGVIKKFNNGGVYQYSWPCNLASEIAVDAGGNLYLTNQAIAAVEKYSNNGTLLASLSRPDVSGWSFGIDVDSDCNIWLGFTNTGVMSKFSYTSSSPREGAAETSAEVSEKSMIGVKAYPNPFTGNVTLTFPEAGTYEIAVYNALGIEVLRRSVNGTIVDLSGDALPAGIYTVNAFGEGYNYSTKIVKNK